MAGETTLEIAAQLERLRSGDAKAADALITRAYNRMLILAHRHMRDFDRLRRFDDTGDVLQSACLRLLRRLKEQPPLDPRAFFIWAAREIRCELLDLIRKHYGVLGAGRNEKHVPLGDPLHDTHNPDRLAHWTELHEHVEKLPDEMRTVFDLLWYNGLTKPEAATILGVSEPTVKRRWAKARLRLQELLHLDDNKV